MAINRNVESEDNIEQIHNLFISHLGSALQHPLQTNKLSTQYHCPNKQCPTNSLGHHSYNKIKLSVSYIHNYFNCWICGYKGKGLDKIAKKILSREEFTIFSEQYKQLYGIYNSTEVEKKNEPSIYQYLYTNNKAQPVVESEQLLQACFDKGLNKELVELYEVLYAPKNRRFLNSIIVPSKSQHSSLNYFISYNTVSKKYFNAPFANDNVIFNENYIDWSKELILVEGIFDYLKLHTYNRTLLFGSTLKTTSLLYKKILQNKTPILFFLDNDAHNKSYLFAEHLIKWDIPVRIAPQLSVNDIGKIPLDLVSETMNDVFKNAKQFTRLNKLNTL